MRRLFLVPLALTIAFAFSPPPAASQAPQRLDMMEFPRPIEALDNVWIEQLTMLEVRDALRDGMTTALILTGGIEENGPLSDDG